VPLTLSAVLAAEAAPSNNVLVPETNELIWATVSFLLLFLLVSKFVFPTIRKTFEERSENIEGKLERAEKDLLAAEESRRQYQQQLDGSERQAQEILDTARANGDRVSAEMRTDAEHQAQRILENGRETIRGERDRALVSLQGEVGGLAVDLATRLVGESLDRERQLRLVDQYIAELPSITGAPENRT